LLDEETMSSCDVLIATARSWDRATRNWQRSPSMAGVRLLIFDRLELLGVEDGGAGEAGKVSFCFFFVNDGKWDFLV
jgi:replicative superfamily II helicase